MSNILETFFGTITIEFVPPVSHVAKQSLERQIFFIYRRPTLYPLEIAVDFSKSL